MKIEMERVQNILSWVKEQIFLDSISDNAKNRIVKRNEIYQCNFGFGIGSEMQKERPCVIIQNNLRNLNSSTVIVAPITHTNKPLPCMAPITTQFDKEGEVLIDGYVNLSHIQTVSKSRLGNFIAKLPNADMKRVNLAIYDTTGLMSEIKSYEEKLKDKLSYIEKIKIERNKVQDDLAKIYSLTNANSVEEVLNFLNKKAKLSKIK